MLLIYALSILFIFPLLVFSSTENPTSAFLSPESTTDHITQDTLCDSVETVRKMQLEISSTNLFCYFHPPKGWDIVEPSSLSPKVKMAFIKKNKKEGFCPSLNLAIEDVEGTLNEYLNDVKAIYEQDRKNHWRKLGKVHTSSGEAQLTEIDTSSHWGPIRLLQLILLKEGRAYIVTAAALKNDFCSFYRDFQDAFHSLTLTQDLFENIPQLERRAAIRQDQERLFKVCKEMQSSAEDKIPPFSNEDFQKTHWSVFEKKVISDFEDMGSFWQTLVLFNARLVVEIAANAHIFEQ